MKHELSPADVIFLKSARITVGDYVIPAGKTADDCLRAELERLDASIALLSAEDSQEAEDRQIMSLMDYADGERLALVRDRMRWQAWAWIFAFAAGVLLVVNLALLAGGVR
jgi:hypothetical protein